jgi:shikimate kinase
MPVRAVFLVGFMASGKSSVGQELARRLGWDFVDLDARIEFRERQTVPEIFRDRGEHGFRLAETSALREVTELLVRDTVVALGGGAFVQERNRELLRQWPSVFLEAPASELWQRSLTDGVERPLRRDDPAEFARLCEQRLPFYREATVTVVTSGKDLASVCDEIERTLQFRGGSEAEGSPQHRPVHSGKVHSEKGESQ